MTSHQAMIVTAHGLTDPGRARKHNEDQFLIANLGKSMVVQHTSLSMEDQTRLHGSFQGTLLVVADGMGGHNAGDQASAVAIKALTEYVLNTMPWFFRLDEVLGDDLAKVLGEALERVEARVRAASDGRAMRPMGTTITMGYVLWPNLYLVHAGDSRCYLWRDGALRQLTRDHTMANLFAEHDAVDDPDEVADGRLGHVLWNAVGGDDDKPVSPDAVKFELRPDDALLLCSDGLHGMLTDERMAEVMALVTPPHEACRLLVDQANASGGEDNVTAVVARFENPPPPAS